MIYIVMAVTIALGVIFSRLLDFSIKEKLHFITGAIFIIFATYLIGMFAVFYSFNIVDTTRANIKIANEDQHAVTELLESYIDKYDGIAGQLTTMQDALYDSHDLNDDLNMELISKELESQLLMESKLSFSVEVSHYTDTGNPMANGQMPYEGAYAGPDMLPLGTTFLIEYEDGTTENGIIKDRGATWAIRVFDRDDPAKVHPGTQFRIDQFVSNVTKEQIMGLGVNKATIYILSWGE